MTYVVGIIALLETFVLFAIANISLYVITDEKLIPYTPIIPTIVFIILHSLNYQYFTDKEEKITKDLETYSNVQKITMYILTLGLIILIIWGYLFDGFYELLFE